MTKEYKQQLTDIGVDLPKALDRFMDNENLLEKFLSKFLQDDNWQLLNENINAGNIQQAFIHAHTMKGVAANLEFTCLTEILTPLTEELRCQKTENIPCYLHRLEQRYNALCQIIRANNL